MTHTHASLSDPASAGRVGVLMGGLSSEREVSLKTGRGVFEALSARGYEVAELDWTPGGPDLASLVRGARPDVIWNALHGTYGEDGAVQGLLTCAGVPFTGAGILASALAMDKVASKRIFEGESIPTPPWTLAGDDGGGGGGGELPAGWTAPLVVKPAEEGSSVGVSVCLREEEIGPALESARSHHGPTLLERYIPGVEIHIGILNERILGSIEVRPAAGFYDYDAKYRRGDTQYVEPALSEETLARAEEVALRAHRVLGITGHSRVDLRVSEAGEPFVLEANTLPGMTSQSLLPKIAARAGIEYGELCARILASARTG